MLRRRIKHAIMKQYLIVLIVCVSLINVLLYLLNNDKSIEVLPKLYSQETLYSHFDFQAVHEHSIIVYSAHLNDVSVPPVVTVIGLGVLKKIPPNVTCRYTGSVLTNERNNSLSRNATLETTGEVVALPEHHNEIHGAVFIHCKLPENQTNPGHVTLLEERYMPPHNNLPIVLPNKRQGGSLWKITMCFSPLFGNNWKQMVETFELARMLGADHAVIYLMNAGVNVSHVLELYKNTGFLEIHTWRDPPQPIHYNGQLAVINDCLLRMRYVSELVLFMDLDEMIIPRSYITWSGVLQHVRSQEGKNSSSIAAFLFRNAFFYNQPIHVNQTQDAQVQADHIPDLKSQTNLSDDQMKMASELGLQTVLRQYRSVKIWKEFERSKNIVDPLKVLTMGIHNAHALVPGYRTVKVDKNVALLHHYRANVIEETVRDTAALRFVPELLVRIQNKFKELRNY